MKKQVLSALAFCSALGIAQAQTDVTKEYLVNPSFETLKAADGTTDVAVKTKLENGLYGWEISKLRNDGNSTFQVESKESGSSNGFPGNSFITPSEGIYYYFNSQTWMYGSNESEIKTKTSKPLSAGKYYLDIDYKAADYSNNNTNGNGTALGLKVYKAGTNELLGENAATKCAYSVVNNNASPNGNTYMQDQAWDKMGVMFTVSEDCEVSISIVQNLMSRGRSDVAYDNLKLYKLDNASETSPANISGLIHTSNYWTLGDWTIEGGNTFEVNTWSHEGEKDGSGMIIPFIQDWVGSGTNAANATISHTVSHLIPGIYEVSGLIRVLNEAGGGITPSGATLFANEGTTDACAGSPCKKDGKDLYGVYGTYTVKGTVGTDGVLTFGIKVANANFNWVSFKNFKLQYLGAASIEQLKATLKEKITEAKAYVENCPKGIAAIVNAAITQGDSAQPTEESLNAAIAALTQAIALAEETAPATEAFKTLMVTCQGYASHSSAEESVKQAFQKAMTDAQTALDAATTVEAIQEATQTLQTACETYILNAAPEEGYPFDYTFLVAEVGNSKDGWTQNISEGSIQNFQYQNNSAKDNGELKKTGYVECWDANPYTATITYTRNELPNGHYKISAYAFTSKGGNTSFIANGKETVLDNSTDLYTQPVIDDVLVDEGKLTFGLNTSNATWVGITNIQLQYLSKLTDTEASAKAKEALHAKLEEAGSMDTETNVGTEAFQIPETAIDAFDKVFDEAAEIYDSSEKVDEIEAATKALEEAMQALKNPTLNAPKEGELFCIANISEGFGYKNNAVSPVYNEAKAEDGEYDLKWYHIVDANYAQALKFTPVEGKKNQYTISFIDEEGNTRYFSTQALAGYMDGGNVSTRHDRIRATKEAEKALPFEISLAGEGVYKLKNTLHGSNIGSTSDDGFFTTNNLSDLSLVKAEKANVPLSITAAGWCTLILPFDAEIPEGFEVYSCTGTEVPVGTSTALVLEKAESIEAHTPYIVKGKNGNTYDFSDYGTALQDQYAAELMTGTFTQQKAVANTYVLQNQEGKVGFYKVGAGSEPTIKPYRAYINADVAEANIVALLLPGIETGINGIVAEDALVNVYDLNGILVRENVKLGQALEGLSKGIYIVNGTKKAVK